MQATMDDAISARRSAPAPYPEGRFADRGIVVCAGGKRYFPCAFVLITILRRVHRCVLPIQVWHLGEREMSEEMRILLGEQGAEIVDAETVLARHPARVSGGWPLKPYAIAHSRFREVLYLDADTVPLVDPAQAFSWAEYAGNGLLLWPDIVNIKPTSPVWARLGLTPVDRASIDSGVLLADKARAWDILDLTIAMNAHTEELYRLIHGDKDSFWLAAELLGRPYGLMPHRPFQFEWDMVQRDPAGEPFVHHRTGSKWLLHQPNRPLAVPALMAECEAALAELRSRWSGHVFHPPARSVRAQAEEQRLVGLRRFELRTAGDARRTIELMRGGRVGDGRLFEQHWAVIDQAGGLALQFYGGQEEVVATLIRDGDGLWLGHGCEPGSEIRLAEPRDGPDPRLADGGRIVRSAAVLVGALAQPGWLAVGYDPARAAALEAALALLNDAFDDVPEQVRVLMLEPFDSPPWRDLFERLSAQLAVRRDERLALARPDRTERPRMLNPEHYARPE